MRVRHLIVNELHTTLSSLGTSWVTYLRRANNMRYGNATLPVFIKEICKLLELATFIFERDCHKMPQSKLCTAVEVSKQIMDAAIQAVKTEEMSQRSAAKAYGESQQAEESPPESSHGTSGWTNEVFPADGNGVSGATESML
ncbi:hypothetical protein RvY_03080-2 [Ramazzottius varieornatus]|uniref:HTH psq-type domain-containing protein n=1 Tax=Ramazzottius varieornatus TaxID=947166 RepID=A0A1D1UQA6_RAMVA|nr:hypothetical protein RvY_03080-2 [Ramazzottius varieornatus]